MQKIKYYARVKGGKFFRRAACKKKDGEKNSSPFFVTIYRTVMSLCRNYLQFLQFLAVVLPVVLFFATVLFIVFFVFCAMVCSLL